jgi:hypothetical protein
MLPESPHNQDHIRVGGQGRMRCTCPDTLGVVPNRGPRQCHAALNRTTLQRHCWPHVESIAAGRVTELVAIAPAVDVRLTVLNHNESAYMFGLMLRRTCAWLWLVALTTACGAPTAPTPPASNSGTGTRTPSVTVALPGVWSGYLSATD